jgi:hypothetical protein
MEITATLTNWKFVPNEYGGYIWGNVFGDTKNRFRDGTRIHTSQIKAVEDTPGGKVAITLNSNYLLSEAQLEGRRCEASDTSLYGGSTEVKKFSAM